MKRKQKPVLHRERANPLSPRLQELERLLRNGPKTIQELVAGLALDTEERDDPIAIVRSYLSKLGKHINITVHFQYGASTYEILQKKSSEPT